MEHFEPLNIWQQQNQELIKKIEKLYNGTWNEIWRTKDLSCLCSEINRLGGLKCHKCGEKVNHTYTSLAMVNGDYLKVICKTCFLNKGKVEANKGGKETAKK